MSSFAINPASKDVKLDDKRAANARFTISNTTEKPVRGTPALIWVDARGNRIEDPARKTWLNLVGGLATRSFESKENKTLDVEIKMPPAAEPGEYFFRLNMSNEADPGGDFEVGPAVRFKVEGVVPPPNGNNFPWGILIAIVIAVVLVGGGIATWLLLPKKTTVPDVVRKTLEEASNSLAIAELRLEVAEQKATGTNQIGIVISQTPQPGEKLVKGAIIDLTVEREQDKVPVPDLIGLPPELLPKVYGQLPLKMARERSAHTGTQQPGMIAAQRPVAGTNVPPGSTINYTVEEKKPDDPAPAYVGTWANENPKTIRITRFTIAWRDKTAFVRVSSRDSVTDWGEKQARMIGNNQLETTWDRGFNVVKLLMTVEGQRIRLNSTFSPKGAGPPQSVTEFFTPQQIHFQIFKATQVLKSSAVAPQKFTPK